MAILEAAAAFVLDILAQNEEVKKFQKEFLDESARWVKSWFLTPEDPRANAKLTDPEKPLAVKQDIIADKLEVLQNDPLFMQELAGKLQAFTAEKARIKNAVTNSSVNAGRDVRIGDDHTVINHHYYAPAPQSGNRPGAPDPALKTELKSLIARGKTKEVVNRLLDITDGETSDTIHLISEQMSRLATREMQGIISYQEATLERNKLTRSLLEVLDGLG